MWFQSKHLVHKLPNKIEKMSMYWFISLYVQLRLGCGILILPKLFSNSLPLSAICRFLFAVHYRGGSRIPCRRGRRAAGGRQHTILSNFLENCMKSRKFWAAGGHTPGAPPWIYHCIKKKRKQTVLKQNRSLQIRNGICCSKMFHTIKLLGTIYLILTRNVKKSPK